MSDKKTVKKKKKTNPNLRLIKNEDKEEAKKKKRKLRKRGERLEKGSWKIICILVRRLRISLGEKS